MIVGSLILLRPVERHDLPVIAKWRNSPEVYEFLFEREPISLAHQERWFENLVSSNDRFCFVIETRDGKSIGLASVFGIDWRNRHAEWGFYIERFPFDAYISYAVIE